MVRQPCLKNITLLEVGLKSLFLEASWNHQGQQNLGLVAAVDPALKQIYGPGEKLQEARYRYLNFFNTNPMASGLMIGIMLQLEESLASGELELSQRNQMISIFSGTLATWGDTIFWQSWLPLCSLATVWAVLSLTESWWPALILPILFCSLALPVRFGGLILAYRQGPDIICKLHLLKLQNRARSLKQLVAVLLGSSTIILLSHTTILAEDGSLSRLWLSFAGVVFFVLALRAASTRTRLVTYWYPLILILVGYTLYSIFKELMN